MRAWLEIEGIRSAGRMQGVIDVPEELDKQLFAPALILPLLALVCGNTAGSGHDAEILVKASAGSDGYPSTFAATAARLNRPQIRETDACVSATATRRALRQRRGVVFCDNSVWRKRRQDRDQRPGEPMKARAIVVEDELTLRQQLEELLARLWPELEIVASVGDGLKAVAALRSIVRT